MQAHLGPTLASCQSLSSLFHVVRACAILSDDTSCAQVLELQLDGGHKGTMPAGMVGFLQKAEGWKLRLKKK